MAGVFLSVDSVQGNGKGMNPYGYVGGNPETKNDPTGQKVMCPDPTCSGGGGNSSTGHGTGRGPVSVCDPTVDACTSSTSPGPSSKKPAPHGLTPTTSPNALLGICYADPACYAALQNYYGLLEREGLVNTIGVVGSFLEMALGFAEDNPELVQQAEDELQTLSEGEAGITTLGCSFTAQTLVSTDHGKQPIATVHDGAKVLAYNPKTRKMEWQPVVHVWIHTDNDLVDLTITTPARLPQGKGGQGQEQQTREVIHTNQKHPFLTIEDGFLPVGQIKVGMHVVRADGRIGVISGWKVVPGVKMMYNLEVAQDHTFTVGSGQWVVHNCAVGPFDNAI